jgi:hypothetical protein
MTPAVGTAAARVATLTYAPDPGFVRVISDAAESGAGMRPACDFGNPPTRRRPGYKTYDEPTTLVSALYGVPRLPPRATDVEFFAVGESHTPPGDAKCASNIVLRG